MEYEHESKVADTNNGRFKPVLVAKFLGIYSILVTITCAVLLALLLSSAKRNESLQQEMSSNGVFGSNNACESCNTSSLQEKFDHCIAAKGELEKFREAADQNSEEITSLQEKYDHCTAAKDELEGKFRAAADQNSAARESSIAMEEINARLNSSLIVMQVENDVLNVSSAACLRSSVKLQEANVDLDAQVDTLEITVAGINQTLESYMILSDELTEEIDRLEQLKLDLSQQVSELAASNTDYARHNAQLNQSLSEARQYGEDLSALNRQYEEQNAELSEVATNLASEIDELEATTAALNATAQEYARLNGLLSANIDRLEDLNENLTDTVTDLTETVDNLSDKNTRLSELNDDLGTIVSFLDETASGVEETYNSIANYLAEQISQSRGLLIEVLANTYRQITYYWICAVNSRFRGASFMNDPNSPMGAGAYSDVVEYIDEILFTDLCFDVTDFEESIAGAALEVLTWSELMAFVAAYVAEGVDYYFPRNGGNGLGEVDWAEAGYACDNLPMDKQYMYLIAN